ncbi:MAG: DUF3780 domain-containing protein [Acetobacter sp.]|nr:DUF3780 domain-containing protein [Acetobacter sp.]
MLNVSFSSSSSHTPQPSQKGQKNAKKSPNAPPTKGFGVPERPDQHEGHYFKVMIPPATSSKGSNPSLNEQASGKEGAELSHQAGEQVGVGGQNGQGQSGRNQGGQVHIMEYMGHKERLILRVLLSRQRWLAIREPVQREFNARLKAYKLKTASWKTGENDVERLLGAELCVLAWAVEAMPLAHIPKAIGAWLGLRPEERWWLYRVTVNTAGRAEDTGIGWRVALKYALSGERESNTLPKKTKPEQTTQEKTNQKRNAPPKTKTPKTKPPKQPRHQPKDAPFYAPPQQGEIFSLFSSS